ncbi:MAG: tetratricopeptide repeat protein [Leptolyngbyaceae cyanobacterium RM2_2_4]|nr:tetratricopeptide repeat protein [Leptolyngbyaceae cyanobacterium RM2_2_4]
MNLSSSFATDDGLPFSLEQCRQRLQRASSEQERLKLLCREGLLLMQAGHYEQAIASYSQALQLCPDNSRPSSLSGGGAGKSGALSAVPCCLRSGDRV